MRVVPQVEDRYPDLNFSHGISSKLFDLVTFLLQLGEDTPSLKIMAHLFKLKADMLKALIQIPMYSTDMPLRTLVRPRAQQRAEQAALLMRDHLGVWMGVGVSVCGSACV